MPELPEVEAWVRELDPLVSARPIERAGPAHVATLKTARRSLRSKDAASPAPAGVASTSSFRPRTASSCSAST